MPIRPVAALVGLVLPLLLSLLVAVAPAQAAGERCVTRASVERCASMITVPTDDDHLYAQGAVGSLRFPRIRVRYVWVDMQRRTDEGWVRAAPRNTNLSDDRVRSQASSTVRSCVAAPPGVYRSRTQVEWKVRGEDGVHTARIASRGVRKSRLCD